MYELIALDHLVQGMIKLQQFIRTIPSTNMYTNTRGVLCVNETIRALRLCTYIHIHTTQS